MIAGPNEVYICDGCVTRCNEIIADEEARHQQRAKRVVTAAVVGVSFYSLHGP